MLYRTLAIALALVLSPIVARADRGALSIDAGGALAGVLAGPGLGTGDNVSGSMMGATLGVRYAIQNSLELSASAVWIAPARFYNDNTTIGAKSGQLQSEMGWYGATVGAQYVRGLVWRTRVGAELGWARVSYTDLDLFDVSNPAGSQSFQLGLADRTTNALVVSPRVGLEWAATDRLSFAVTPRLDILVGAPQLTSFTVPITASWSWYGLFR